MEKVISALEQIKQINSAYGISNNKIDEMQNEMIAAKVCTPIIGKFSSGKSALVNTILGYRKRILKEDITPETAVPAEIVYSDSQESITLIKNDGTSEGLSVDEYRNYEADANMIKSIRIQLRNSFLEEIPDVMLVDMPGFESGFQIHNKAIDNYLPRSLAYIVAFPADDMIVRSSIGNILKELCLYDMPLCVVVTKCDKKNDDFEETFEKMKEGLKRFVGERDICYCETSSRDGEAEELKRFLKQIQSKSQELLENRYKRLVLPIVENTENYLKTTLANSQLSESELDDKEEKLQNQLSSLDSNCSKEQEDFNEEISRCAEEIKNDVWQAMEAEESRLVAMAMNNQSINERLNMVVRNAVTVSVKQRFIPKVEKYLKNIAKTINSESIGDVHILFSFDTDKINTGITSSIVAVAAGILLGLPILGIAAAFLMKHLGDKKREEEKQQISMKLRNEVFPQVLNEVGHGIENTIAKQVQQINASIEDEIKNQRETLEKAMADVRTRLNDEKQRKENLVIDIKEDLERIGEIKDGLQ